MDSSFKLQNVVNGQESSESVVSREPIYLLRSFFNAKILTLHVSRLLLSLTSRDLIISQGKYPLFMENSPLSPVSDGAGVILEVGSNVSDWKKDDRVMCIFHQGHLYGIVPTPKELRTGTGGGVVDGMLSEYRVVSIGPKKE